MRGPSVYMPEDLLDKYKEAAPERLGFCVICGKGLYENGAGDIQCENCGDYPDKNKG